VVSFSATSSCGYSVALKYGWYDQCCRHASFRSMRESSASLDTTHPPTLAVAVKWGKKIPNTNTEDTPCSRGKESYATLCRVWW
jgi:hypothetical protein